MNKSSGDKLSNAKIQQLLAAVGSASGSDMSDPVEAVDYDWRQPRFFNSKQLAQLEHFAGKVGAECVGEFSKLFKCNADVSVLSTAPCFWQQTNTENQPEYYITFGVDLQNPFGLISIPSQSASNWTEQILGVSESAEETGRKLSKLEESILLDIASGLVKAFSRVYGSDLRSDTSIECDRSSVMFHESKELFKITIEARKADSGEDVTQVSFWTYCEDLRSLAGGDLSGEVKKTAVDNARVMQGYVQALPVSLTVELGKAILSFEEIMDLQVNDIVVLDKKATDTVEVLLEDRVFFKGWAARSGGKHAVVIA